jgi:AraC family transcriptional regulator, transcriptional activator of pobA
MIATCVRISLSSWSFASTSASPQAADPGLELMPGEAVSPMDSWHKILDNLNIRAPPRSAMDLIPTYTLYGESDENIEEQWIHCESIAARSARFEWRIEAHRHHNFFQILHVRRGPVEATIEGQTIAPHAPVVITIPPETVHGFRFAKEVEGNVVTVPFGRVERLLDSCPGARDMFLRPQVVPLARPGLPALEIERLTAAIAVEFAASSAWRSPLIEAHLVAMLVLVARLVSDHVVQSERFSPLNRRAMEFRVLVDRTYRNRLSVAEYAAKLGTSQTHLNRICRAAFNESALALIDRRIILEATRDLTFTLKSIKEIAVSLGFDDQAYFTRFFTKHVGLSPTQFRRRQARAPARENRRSRPRLGLPKEGA